MCLTIDASQECDNVKQLPSYRPGEQEDPGHMSEIAQLQRELVARMLEGDGKAAPELRRAAFDNAGFSEPIQTLIEKVAERSHQVTDGDIAAVRAAGLSEDEIFEIVVCTAVGHASRQYASALAALAGAVEGKAGQ